MKIWQAVGQFAPTSAGLVPVAIPRTKAMQADAAWLTDLELLQPRAITCPPYLPHLCTYAGSPHWCCLPAGPGQLPLTAWAGCHSWTSHTLGCCACGRLVQSVTDWCACSLGACWWPTGCELVMAACFTAWAQQW
jgi:hypothetical protein